MVELGSLTRNAQQLAGFAQSAARNEPKVAADVSSPQLATADSVFNVNPLSAALPPPCAAATDQTRWFLEEVQPHESSLRAYLRARFPGLTDPDDLVQETYLRLMRARVSGRVDLNKGYIFAVARNAAFDLCRRKQVISFENIADIERRFVLDSRPDAAEAASREQDVAILIEAIQALPERCRQVVTLRKIFDLTHKEIALKLGIAENTVNVQITLGMARLRDYLRARGVNSGNRK